MTLKSYYMLDCVIKILANLIVSQLRKGYIKRDLELGNVVLIVENSKPFSTIKCNCKTFS